MAAAQLVQTHKLGLDVIEGRAQRVGKLLAGFGRGHRSRRAREKPDVDHSFSSRRTIALSEL